jgi:hypothetical protein
LAIVPLDRSACIGVGGCLVLGAPAFAAIDSGPLENRKEYGSKPASKAKTTEKFLSTGSVPLIPMVECSTRWVQSSKAATCSVSGLSMRRRQRIVGQTARRGSATGPRVNCAVDRDAVPSQQAVRGNKAPSFGARLGRRSRRRGLRHDVGGPRLHFAGGAATASITAAKTAELCNASLPELNMHDCDLVQSRQGRRCQNGSRATVILKGQRVRRRWLLWGDGR